MKPNSLFISALTLLLLSSTVFSVGYNYRYVDNEGRTHIGYSVPPEFVANGYEILSENGQVVDAVLPKHELDARASKMLRDAEEKHKRDLQRAKDETLLRYYSTPEDVERVSTRKLQEFDNFVEIQTGNIRAYKNRMEKLQSQAANLERAGRTVPQKIIETLGTLDEKILEAEEAIKVKKEEKTRVRMAFEADIKRLQELLEESGRAVNR